MVLKDDLTFRDSRLSVATCMCHIELYLMHIQVKGAYTQHSHINKVIADMYVQRLGGLHQNTCRNIMHYSRIKQQKEISPY